MFLPDHTDPVSIQISELQHRHLFICVPIIPEKINNQLSIMALHIGRNIKILLLCVSLCTFVSRPQGCSGRSEDSCSGCCRLNFLGSCKSCLASCYGGLCLYSGNKFPLSESIFRVCWNKFIFVRCASLKQTLVLQVSLGSTETLTIWMIKCSDHWVITRLVISFPSCH